jgi:hypothetical protein
MTDEPTTPPPGHDRPAWEQQTQQLDNTAEPPAAAGEPGKPWWKKWWGITLIVVLVLAVISAMTGDPDEDDALSAEDETEQEQAADPEDAGEEVDEETEIEEAEEEVDAEPEVDEAEEEMADEVDEAAEEPEPDFEITEETARTIIFPIVWDSARDGTRQIIADLTVIQTVDLYDYDADSGTIILDATPEFDFDSGVRDDAWQIMRIFAGGLYDYPDAGNWVEPESGWAPALDVTISTARYRCDGDTMQALGDARMSRAQWETECRVN